MEESALNGSIQKDKITVEIKPKNFWKRPQKCGRNFKRKMGTSESLKSNQ
jgi:hypothetical protein